jgi:dihydrodipicolinate synthase/N-acetylneuraminate lyase
MAAGLSAMLDNVRAMADAGAHIAVVTAPSYFVYNQQEVETIFRKFADASPLPVMIYDIPDLAGIKLALKMTSRLVGHQNVIGIKDSSSDMDRFSEMLELLTGLEDFYLLQGKEHLLAESLLNGASGFVVSLLHIDPRPFVYLYQAVRRGDSERARRLQKGITTVLRLVEDSFKRRPETSTLFHFLNCALRQRRVCDNILLEHEGDCPRWLADKARLAVGIFQGVSVLD